MANKAQTTSEASEKSNINENTLRAWVRNNKVKTECVNKSEIPAYMPARELADKFRERELGMDSFDENNPREITAFVEGVIEMRREGNPLDLMKKTDQKLALNFGAIASVGPK